MSGLHPYWKAGQAAGDVTVGPEFEIALSLSAKEIVGDVTRWRVERDADGEWAIRKIDA